MLRLLRIRKLLRDRWQAAGGPVWLSARSKESGPFDASIVLRRAAWGLQMAQWAPLQSGNTCDRLSRATIADVTDKDPLASFPPFQGGDDSAITAVLAHWRQQQQRAYYAMTGNLQMSGALHALHIPAESVKVSDSVEASREDQAARVPPDILLQATVVNFGDKTSEGQLIEAVAIPWFEIIRQLERDPDFMFTVPWRTLEEIIAGAYTREGFPEVTLTPRSGDGGRDVIATKPGVGSIRIFDQVKAYAPGHVVTAEQVDSMLGVLTRDSNVSKGLVTTTSTFAPRLLEDESLKRLIPYRLELKDGRRLREWLIDLAKRSE
jgi:restriction system protein